ncbi:hypothetical protein HRbin11_00875 [bacterium HR11]|nr:hypothetical protein HRbin11_00875 [bacterium HR11]
MGVFRSPTGRESFGTPGVVPASSIPAPSVTAAKASPRARSRTGVSKSTHRVCKMGDAECKNDNRAVRAVRSEMESGKGTSTKARCFRHLADGQSADRQVGRWADGQVGRWAVGRSADGPVGRSGDGRLSSEHRPSSGGFRREPAVMRTSSSCTARPGRVIRRKLETSRSPGRRFPGWEPHFSQPNGSDNRAVRFMRMASGRPFPTPGKYDFSK